MLSVIVGFCVGFVLTIPPGPVAAFTIESTVHHGKRAGRQVALGVAIVDTLFCLGVLFASSAFVQLGAEFASAHRSLFFILSLCVVVAILCAGLLQIFRSPSTTKSLVINVESHLRTNKPLFIGAATAVSNGINPTFIPSLMAIITSVHTQFPDISSSIVNRVVFAAGFGAGTFAWISIITAVAVRHHGLLSAETLRAIRRGGGVVFVVFGLWLLWKILGV
mgnify:FL=1